MNRSSASDSPISLTNESPVTSQKPPGASNSTPISAAPQSVRNTAALNALKRSLLLAAPLQPNDPNRTPHPVTRLQPEPIDANQPLLPASPL